MRVYMPLKRTLVKYKVVVQEDVDVHRSRSPSGAVHSAHIVHTENMPHNGG